MTLEDQIRRMGEVRAAEVHTPSWRDRVGTNGVGRRWIVAAVAALALVGGGAAFMLIPGDDSADVNTADAEGGELRHWIPAVGGEVTGVEYGSTPVGGFFASPGQQNALITTPDDATDPDDDDWTWVSINGPLLLQASEDNDPTPSDGPDGESTFTYRSGDGEVWVRSRRFDAADIRSHEAELRALGPDISAIAAEIASWDDDVEVVFAGDAAAPDLTVATDDALDGGFVLRIDERDPLRFAATYRWALEGPDDAVAGMFALEDDGELNASYAMLSAAAVPTEITDDEWTGVLDRLIGPDPLVRVGLGDAESGRAVVATYRGHHTVAIDLVPSTAVLATSDAGPTQVGIGTGDGTGISLIFESEPSGVPGRLIVQSRMSEAEARRYAELINGALDEPVPPTEPYPTADPTQTGICAANPVPSHDVLAIATHIAFDRSPLDLDQDGVDDEMLVYDDGDGNWRLIARLQAGWTNALGIGTPPTAPGLAQTSGGVPAGTDLDGDGGLEFFVTGFLGPSAKMLTLRGCELVDKFFLDEPAEGLGATFGVQIGLSPDMPLCQGRACATRVRCAGGVLTQELFVGVAANDDPGYWTTAELRLDPSGVITSTELPNRPVGPFDGLDDPPTEATTGVIDCTPDGSGDVAQITRPECAGNAPPPDASDPRPVVLPDEANLDVDNDGFADELTSFIGDDRRVWLVLHLGDGNYTNAIPVWFNDAQLRPGPVATPDGEIAAADLTGNGSNEIFIGGFGNTARSAGMLGLDGCLLRTFPGTGDSIQDSFGVLIGVGGNSCAPIACVPRVSCVDGVLITEITGPVDAFDPNVPLSDVEVRWTTTTWDYVDDTFVIAGESETTFLASERPDDVPSISDVIDCRP